MQDKLLSVVDTFVGPPPADPNSNPYFGARRGLAGVVMDNQQIRESLAPAIMNMYSTCHAVVGLDVNEDAAFNKYTVRNRANQLICHLYRHPLEEPRHAMRKYVKANEDGRFDALIVEAFTTISYGFKEAIQYMKDAQMKKNGIPKHAQQNPQVGQAWFVPFLQPITYQHLSQPTRSWLVSSSN
jgi:hypothetical protein